MQRFDRSPSRRAEPPLIRSGLPGKAGLNRSHTYREAPILIWLFVVVILACLSLGLLVEYPATRWVACKKAAERLRPGHTPPPTNFWGYSITSPRHTGIRDYEDAAVRHEDALVKLGRLARKEFHLRNAIRSDAHFAELMSPIEQRRVRIQSIPVATVASSHRDLPHVFVPMH
jgi:hypothetical protein